VSLLNILDLEDIEGKIRGAAGDDIEERRVTANHRLICGGLIPTVIATRQNADVLITAPGVGCFDSIVPLFRQLEIEQCEWGESREWNVGPSCCH